MTIVDAGTEVRDLRTLRVIVSSPSWSPRIFQGIPQQRSEALSRDTGTPARVDTSLNAASTPCWCEAMKVCWQPGKYAATASLAGRSFVGRRRTLEPRGKSSS